MGKEKSDVTSTQLGTQQQGREVHRYKENSALLPQQENCSS